MWNNLNLVTDPDFKQIFRFPNSVSREFQVMQQGCQGPGFPQSIGQMPQSTSQMQTVPKVPKVPKMPKVPKVPKVE